MPPLGAISKKWGMVTLGNSKKGKKDEKVTSIWRWVTSLKDGGGPAALRKKEEGDKGFCVGASSTTLPQEEYIEEGGEVTRAKDVTGVTSLKDGGDPVSTPHPVAGVEDIMASQGADDQDSTSTIAVKGGHVCSEEDILTQQTGSGGGGMKDEDAMPKAEVSLTAGSQGKCVHLRGGRCLTHGLGAKYVFKPRNITEEGPDGKKTRRVEKKWFWRCDVDVRGRKMKQSCISYFLKADTPGRAAGNGMECVAWAHCLFACR